MTDAAVEQAQHDRALPPGDAVPDGSLGDAVVAAYLGNYLTRAIRSGGRFLPGDEANALVFLLIGELRRRVSSTVPTAALRVEHDRAVADLTGSRSPDSTYNLLALAWLTGRSPPATPAAELAEVLATGAAPEAIGSMSAIGWRVLTLAMASATDTALVDELQAHIGRIVRWADQQTPRMRAGEADLQVVSRVAYTTALASSILDDHRLVSVSRELVAGLTELRAAGELPGKTGQGPAHSSVLGQVLLAAGAAGSSQLHDDIRLDLTSRVDQDRFLVRIEPSIDKYDFSPWVPLAFLSLVTETTRIEDVLDPQVAPLPAFAVERVVGGEAIAVELRDGDREFSRLISAHDLNLLLDRILRTFAKKDTSPRQHGHMVIALGELDSLEPAPDTREAIDQLFKRGLDVIEAEQQPNGGWFYSHKGVPSVVYSAGKRSTTEFPDFQYTIDASVPGVALCQAFLRTGDGRYLDAARRALHFFENTIGRVDWEGHSVWRLYPEDEKTARMGTAVNYELWAGYFFGWLLVVEPDVDVRKRLRGYLTDIVRYSARHLEDNGDIAYGDYVDEKRTAYASWDAFLLREIGERAQMPEAIEMSDRIVDRVGELVLDSGVVPNVSDYFDEVDGHRRWLVHRHGVGPYPVRAYYQLYFAVAGSHSAGAREAAARALAYTLVDLFEPITGGLNPGYIGRGEQDVRPGVTARDWAVLALAAIPHLTGARYRPDHRHVESPRRRIERAVDGLDTRLAEDVCNAGGVPGELGEAALWWARGCLAVPRIAEARDEAVRRVAVAAERAPTALGLSLMLDLGIDANAAARQLGSGQIGLEDTVSAAAAVSVLCRAGVGLDDELLAPIVARLESGQAQDGLLPEGTASIANANALAIAFLLDARETHPRAPSINGILRSAIKGVWRSLFNPRGQGFSDRGHAYPMAIDEHALAAMAFRRAVTELRWERLAEPADRVTLYFFLGHGSVDGAPGARDGERERRILRDARTFYALARQEEQLVAWLEREMGIEDAPVPPASRDSAPATPP